MLFRSITSHPSNPLSATALTELRRNTALATFNAQMAAETGITSQSAQMTEITNGVQVSGSGVANNVFGGLLGITSSNIAVTSAATSRLLSDRLEVAFVLDNTGSMASLNKMPLLKASMHKFLMKLQSGQSSISDVKVSLVPFDTKVRIDPIFATGKPWMRQSAIELLGWGGCIEDRVQPYDTNATTPALVNPDTLFDAVDGSYNVFPTLFPSPCNLPKIQPLTTSFTSFASAEIGRAHV